MNLQNVVTQCAAPKISATWDEAKAADVARKYAMRRFFALAQAEGLDCKDSERMREALGFYLGHCVYSRAGLSSGQWSELEAALWVGLLAW